MKFGIRTLYKLRLREAHIFVSYQSTKPTL